MPRVTSVVRDKQVALYQNEHKAKQGACASVPLVLFFSWLTFDAQLTAAVFVNPVEPGLLVLADIWGTS